ncbi:MAG: RnfABCDGE type electron transport complex subunit D, partial [bacterium]
VMLAAVFFFGVRALLLLATCAAGSALTEWIFAGRGPFRNSTVSDGSAILTGILLALTLPPGLPLWMAFLGAVIAVLLGTIIFGGLGHNIFNPSLTGRAFLQACFPVALTTWIPYGNLAGFLRLDGGTLTIPFTHPAADVVTAATPLAKMKFESVPTTVSHLLVGTTAGSLGETSALLILLGGAYLAYRKFLNWRIPAGIIGTVFVLATILHLINPAKYPDGVFHLFSGGLMLGAVFMATDPVTSPVTPRGSWFFAAGVGVLVVAIRQFGGLPEGVMYSILLMNGLTPLIDRYTQPQIYGAAKKPVRQKS